MRSVVRAELRHNGRRAVSSALAIALAVAFVAAALGATATMKDYLLRSAGAAAFQADVVITPPTPGFAPGPAEGASAPQGPAPEALLAAVRSAPGIAALYRAQTVDVPIMFTPGTGTAGTAAAGTVITFTPAKAAPPAELSWYRLSAGHLPTAPGEILVDTATAKAQGLQVGSVLPLGSPLSGSVTISGLVPPGDLRVFGDGGGRSVVARPADVATWVRALVVGAPGQKVPAADVAAAVAASLGSIYLAADPGVSPAQLQSDVQTALQAQLPAAATTLVVEPGADAAQRAARQATSDVDLLSIVLLGFAAVSLFVAMIVIANTFAIIAAQRTTQLALVRCIGATRRQVFRATIAEAVVIGLVASLIGAALGVGLVLAGAAVLPQVVDGADGVVGVVPWLGLIGAVGVGVLVTLGAALLPARRSTRVAPLAALRPTPVPSRRAGRLRAGLGLAVCAAGAAGFAVAFIAAGRLGPDEQPSVPVAIGLAAAFALVIGVLVSGQLIAPAVAQLLGRLSGVVTGGLGPVGRLAVGNTVRNPARASATSMALFVGVCLVTSMATGAATALAAANTKLYAGRPLDVIVTDVGNDLGRRLAEQLAAVPGTTASATLGTMDAKLDSDPLFFMVGDPVQLARVYRAPLPLAAGTVLVPAPYSGPASMTLSRGSTTLKVAVKAATVDAPVIALADAKLLAKAVVPAAAQESKPAPTAVAYVWLRAADGVDAQGYQDAVNAILAEPEHQGVDAEIRGSLLDRAAIQQTVTVMLGIATGLLAVALLISVLGISNTMVLSVLERRRETGVQRALGLTRRQLRSCLTLEAVLLALVGVVLGVGLGLGFGFAGVRLALAGTVSVTTLSVPWGILAGIVAGAVLCAVLASILPGRRAGRIPATQALAAM